MAGYHAQVALRNRTGEASDTFVNTFSINLAGSPTEAQAAQVAADIAGFYDHVGSLTYSIENYMSEVLEPSANAHTVKVYGVSGNQLTGSPLNPLGSPLAEQDFQLSGGTSDSPMPSEVAVAITLEGAGRAAAAVEVGATRPKQRHTGRIYIGPLNTGAIDTLAVGEGPKVHPSFITTALEAIQWLHDELQADGTLGLAVWSRSNATMYTLESASIDKRFDTVRSRGDAPVGRTRVSIS